MLKKKQLSVNYDKSKYLVIGSRKVRGSISETIRKNAKKSYR